ncbi:hypothetical protein BDP27DRAFT_1232463 [Rhodocollybia butyracea]|uniref:Uncharacterized protein n=1 Tax=Rhodocollybia butyracea TaxID=206335 RepID=A0A9P5PG38_9AGAR|nr:hypothetical protein BDP27DRAFT_1232463 [Rhodocollybia butyracea]
MLTHSLTVIQIGDTTITSIQIAAEIAKVDGVGAEKAADLMDLHDKQNVPKATMFLSVLPRIDPNSDVATEAERQRKIAFLGQVLSYFFIPFTSAKMSLSDQVFHLATYVHLTYAMYKCNGLRFFYMPIPTLLSKRYSPQDSRVHSSLHSCPCLILDGTDKLEGLFSNIHTQDHSQNFDTLQLAQKLSIAAEHVAVFSCNPDMDRGH